MFIFSRHSNGHQEPFLKVVAERFLIRTMIVHLCLRLCLMSYALCLTCLNAETGIASSTTKMLSLRIVRSLLKEGTSKQIKAGRKKRVKK